MDNAKPNVLVYWFDNLLVPQNYEMEVEPCRVYVNSALFQYWITKFQLTNYFFTDIWNGYFFDLLLSFCLSSNYSLYFKSVIQLLILI